jgi:hypothetical protein
MPRSPREINDQITDSRMRKVIRYLLDQEVRRLNSASATLTAQVATNTANISANASGIATNVADIDNVERRALARNNFGLISSRALRPGGGAVVVSETAFASVQEWTLQIPMQPIEVTLWKKQSFVASAQFDTFQFDAVQFDEGLLIQAVDQSTAPTYTPNTNTFSIDWGSAKSGTVYLLDQGSGTAYSVVAVAD